MNASRLLSLTVVIILAAAAAAPALAQRADDSKRLSKNGKTEAAIDGVDVVLEYGRPNVKGRQVWGGLVPYDQVWRTGANEATTISFSDDVTVNGEELGAGTYSLFTIPGKEKWEFIFNNVAEQWGAFSYNPDSDALRVSAKPAKAEHVESMKFDVDGSSVIFRWEKLAVPFEVKAAGD